MITNLNDIDDGRPGWEQPGHLASTGLDELMLKVVQAAAGRDALTRRPSTPGSSLTWTTPTDFADGVLVARRLRAEATKLMDTFVRKARGEGVDWAALAPALGVVESEYAALDELAYQAYQDLHGEHSSRHVSWTCGACLQHVTDKGPYNRHPDDVEQGHADTCTRYLAALRAFQDERDAEDARYDAADVSDDHRS